ncbi:MAG: type I-E CRISPR-associated protein Cas7/Cse4/CasC [Gallionellales bacterium RBG_16_57_15]|nr:MAG: type I-E CRISPR-associated protein Cas7/Cse4/CasC [Gallionellales bacterium RBG_16_57_15]
MSRFVQIHLLVSYPPSNLNRDDTGRPKTAIIGDANRLRISSQSLKRAWRTSDELIKHLPGSFEKMIGKRTKKIGLEWIHAGLVDNGVNDEVARKWSRDIIRAYGAPEGDKDDGSEKALQSGQLVHISPAEQEKLIAFIKDVALYLKQGAKNEAVESAEKAILARDKASDKKKANGTLARALADLLLVKDSTAVDIALFGRMLASVPAYGFEAAVQVAHAITVHKVAVEDDYFSAVDDLNRGEEDVGAAHIGEAGFGAGVFYLYLCINRELLLENLGDDASLTAKTLEALVHAATKVSPTGKQNSFASRAYAAYALAEKGDQQPRSLAQAFLKPVTGGDMLARAISEMKKRYENFDKVYGACADSRYQFNVETGEGSVDELVKFVTG